MYPRTRADESTKMQMESIIGDVIVKLLENDEMKGLIGKNVETAVRGALADGQWLQDIIREKITEQAEGAIENVFFDGEFSGILQENFEVILKRTLEEGLKQIFPAKKPARRSRKKAVESFAIEG